MRRLKAESDADISVGGAVLGAEAFRLGLVDETVLVLHPVAVGGGKPALPLGVRLDLELLGTRRFDTGAVYVRHAVRRAT